MAKKKGSAIRRRKKAVVDKPYKGIRARWWGKWVAEIREPVLMTRIWLGSYTYPIAAAKAYDTAVFYLRCPPAKLNFPYDFTGVQLRPGRYDPEYVRLKALTVGAMVDAREARAAKEAKRGTGFDLNRMPDDMGDE